MECNVVRMDRNDPHFYMTCMQLEAEIVKENLAGNGGTLNYSHLTINSEDLFLAMVGDKVVGFASMVYYDDSYYVYQIAVKKEFQQQGIGMQLMEAVIAHAKEIGKDVTANVRDYNENSKKMFMRLGFTRLSEEGASNGYYRLYQKKDTMGGLK